MTLNFHCPLWVGPILKLVHVYLLNTKKTSNVNLFVGIGCIPQNSWGYDA